MDMFPSLLEMCGLPPRSGFAGVSFAPQLKNPATPRDPSLTANEKEFTVRSERWRYIAYLDGSEELYDHNKDPNEWDNLAGKPDFSETVKTLKAFVPKNPVPARKVDAGPNGKGKKGKGQRKQTAQLDSYMTTP